MSPCILFEDEHLLAVNKPAGWNTHAPGSFAGEGIYDWLKHREPRWAGLAIIHRLDKETSGVMVFGKTATANRSLTEQFTRHIVRKKYLLLTDRAVKQREFVAKSKIVRVGERYVSGARGETAETRFQIRNPKSEIRNRQGGRVHSIPLRRGGSAAHRDLPQACSSVGQGLVGPIARRIARSLWQASSGHGTPFAIDGAEVPGERPRHRQY